MSYNDLTLNPNLLEFYCSVSQKTLSLNDLHSPIGLCSCCKKPGYPLLARYDLEKFKRNKISYRLNAPGMLRYSPILPVAGIPQDYICDVGDSKIYSHERLSSELGVELSWKCEASNPSGSFKDRGLAIGIILGVSLGAKRFCLPTQGNAGIAAALFSSRLGLEPALIYMPEGHRNSRYHHAARAFGATIKFYGNNIKAAGSKMRSDLASVLEDGSYVDLSTFFEPGRLEGKKTLGYEIVDHFGPTNLPD
ncbi:MAG: pyridoxal-phosphate dependent enzyme, partial [Francisellaceae bacterium]|nr:pyridoxal-phosphate dependent enzyme [Francisellaceae bacterium]